MITKQELSGKWNSIAGAVKEKYGQITDDDLSRVQGNADQLIGLIQQKTGQSREQIESFIDDACQNCGSTSEQVSAYMESATEAVRDGYEHVAQRAKQGYDQSTEMLARRPVESVLTALGVGLITGIAIGLSIAERRHYEPTWRDRWLS